MALKLLVLSAVAAASLHYLAPEQQLQDSIRLATLNAWGEPLQSLIGVELIPLDMSPLSRQTRSLVAAERLWGLWLLISSLWAGRRLVGEAQLSARLSALLRRK